MPAPGDRVLGVAWHNDGPMSAPAFAHHRPRLHAGLAHPRYWLTWLGFGLLWCSIFLPRIVLSAIGAALGQLYFYVGRKRRRVALTNLALCFPALSPVARRRLARAHFRLAIQCALDLPYLWWASARRIESRLAISGGARLDALAAEGRNIVLLLPHCVAMETSAWLSRGRATVSMMKPARNAVVDYFLTRARTRFGARLVARQQGLRGVVRALRAGVAFVYFPDEDLGLKDAAFAPFFGVPAATVTTVGRLAELTDAVVVPCFPRREGRRYTLDVQPPLADFPTGDATRDATRMNAALEAGIEQDPRQYLWTFKRFKNRPAGQAPVYD